MLGKHLVRPSINILLTLICIALGVYSYGVPLLFDCISTFSFLVIAYIFRADINIKTVCILLVIENTIINLSFLMVSDNLIYAAICYGITAITLWVVRADTLAKPIAILLFIALANEIYWYKSGHPPPLIYFHFLKISLSLMVRFLLLYRPHGLNYFLNSGASILRLDWFVYKTIWVACIVECAMISEFLIRHSLGIHAMLIYNSYEYIMQALSVWVLWLVVREAIKIQRENVIQA